MRLLADKYIYKLAEHIPAEIELHMFDPLLGLPDTLDGYDALFTRTVTKLNAHTFPYIPSSLQFIGTASAGSDHFDHEYLHTHGLKVVDAKGCNANAVAEYVITALLLWSEEQKVNLQEVVMGIIGVGYTGSAVAHLLDRLHIRHIDYDPPRERADRMFKSATESELMECDILTFHVPLIQEGPDQTRYWLNSEVLKGNTFKLIINCSRGGVVNEKDVLAAKESGIIGDYVLDVWENEPEFDIEIAKSAYLATPHIAGYSNQAKLNATEILVKKLTRYFGMSYHGKADPEPETKQVHSNSISTILDELNPIRMYHNELIQLCDDAHNRGTSFLKLRVDKPYRNEYPFISMNTPSMNNSEVFYNLGIKSF